MPRRNSTLQAADEKMPGCARRGSARCGDQGTPCHRRSCRLDACFAERFSNSAGWSSATIRNVMAELEEAGLVEQPHTSAGRVPTDKGYRYYVDNLLEEGRLSRADLRAIERVFPYRGLDSGHFV